MNRISKRSPIVVNGLTEFIKRLRVMDASQHRELSLEGRMSRGEYIRKKAIVAILDEVMNEYGHNINIYLVRNKIVNELKASEYE